MKKHLFYRTFLKRFLDFIISLIAILILSPLYLILIILGTIFMKGNPFFLQPRTGKDDKTFTLIKFRSMTNKKDKDGKLLPDSERYSKYGDFIRKTSLDELPELFNIFIGQMSIVGPRPLVTFYLPYYTSEEEKRHTVRPGLTGLAQVNGRTVISWEDKFKYDVDYVENMSLFLDIKIIFLTIAVLFKTNQIISDVEQVNLDVYRKEQKRKEGN